MSKLDGFIEAALWEASAGLTGERVWCGYGITAGPEWPVHLTAWVAGSTCLGCYSQAFGPGPDDLEGIVYSERGRLECRDDGYMVRFNGGGLLLRTVDFGAGRALIPATFRRVPIQLVEPAAPPPCQTPSRPGFF